MVAVMTDVQTIRIGLTDEQRNGVNDILRRVLSDEYILYTRLRNYHWNVGGPMFHMLHEQFEAQYTRLETMVDDVAERSRALGQPAIGTLTEFLNCGTLTEQPAWYPNGPTMVITLVDDHEAIIRNLRRDIDTCEQTYGDMGTSDFLTGLMEQHEEMAWMLRAFISETA
jgi:starvation-inducible DNA-binding protein